MKTLFEYEKDFKNKYVYFNISMFRPFSVQIELNVTKSWFSFVLDIIFVGVQFEIGNIIRDEI